MELDPGVRGHLIRRQRGQLPSGVSGGMDAGVMGLSLRMGRRGEGPRPEPQVAGRRPQQE